MANALARASAPQIGAGTSSCFSATITGARGRRRQIELARNLSRGVVGFGLDRVRRDTDILSRVQRGVRRGVGHIEITLRNRHQQCGGLPGQLGQLDAAARTDSAQAPQSEFRS